MSNAEWNKHFYEKGKDDVKNNENRPPNETEFFHPGAFDLGGEKVFTTSDAQSAYDAGRSDGGAEEKSSGCFLTTACVSHMGLPDDCHELTTLRAFRDEYVALLPDGTSILSEYYQTAPVIVSKIQAHPNRDIILSEIFGTVRSAVNLIEHGADEAAFIQYSDLFSKLKQEVYV